MANNLRNASAPTSAILTDKDGITGAEVVTSAPSAGQSGLVVYTVAGAGITQTQDGADGTVGALPPTTAIQIGVLDVNGKLQPLTLDASGNLKVTGGGSSSGTTAISAGTATIGKVGMAGRTADDADGRVVIGSEGLPLSQFQGTEFTELAVQDVNLARVLGSNDLTANGRLKVDSLTPDPVFSGFISAQRTIFSAPCGGYATATVQLGGTWTGTITFEAVSSGSATTGADPVISCFAVNTFNNVVGSTATANGIYRLVSSGFSRLQMRFSTATSGIPQVTVTLSAAPIVPVVSLVSTVTQVSASRTVGNIGAVMDAVINTGAAPANVLWTQQAPATASAAALSVSAQSALTVANVKASAGNVYGVSVQNPNASTIFIQFYNTAGTPTLGTSVIWWLPVGASATVFFGVGTFALANFATGIGVGAATTATGAGAPGSAPAVVVHYL